jgi:hypothetical protein
MKPAGSIADLVETVLSFVSPVVSSEHVKMRRVLMT